MNKNSLEKIIYKMLDLKLLEVKREIKNISFNDLYGYLMDVILKKNSVKDLNDISFYIMNIKINKLFEYMNLVEITQKNDTVINDLKSILEG
ncbi:hypothetical protein [Spiroplasma taiwanense]|uniref:Uncharacterized protein n=1 Tax=Spiroplasma taiwanense CT-1 TaxID=1276220 RepID=S5LWP0_9MOLU|nr:hypothetical protein [Spiroplasma taiwanense]AGR41056.1 hypothetical protein STAIW_v1c04060 [Spiroplasma taiwanense CT-1]